MNKYFKLLTFLALQTTLSCLYAQNIGISSTGATPDSTAALDISSTTKGLLIPRMTTTQRNAITTPATGLMIYNTTTGTYDFYSGSWTQVNPTVTPVANGGTGQTTANASLNALLPSQTSNSGKFLTTDGTNASWSNLYRTLVTTSSDQSLTSTSWTNVTGLSFTATSGTVYHFTAFFLYNNTGATTDYVDISFSGPASPTLMGGYAMVSKTTNSVTQGTNTVYDDGIAPSASLVGINVVKLEGIIKTSSTGTVVIRAKAITANKATIKAGGSLEYW